MTKTEAQFEIALLAKSFERNEDQRIAAINEGNEKLERQCIERRNELNAKHEALEAIVNPTRTYED